MTIPIDRDAIKSLHAYATTLYEQPFADLCSAALRGEEWAADRIHAAFALFSAACNPTTATREAKLRVIHTTDCTRFNSPECFDAMSV